MGTLPPDSLGESARTNLPSAEGRGIVRGFVLGAGLGTRLRPLTEDLPKPLVPVFQKRLVTFAFDHLISVGVREIVVNTHHAAHRWGEFFPEGRYGEAKLIFVHEPVLLETGGGIRNVASWLGCEPFFVYNGDTLTDLPLWKLSVERERTGCEVVVALRSGGGPARVAWDSVSGRVVDLAGLAGSGEEARFVFTGHYLAGPELHEFLTPGKIESVVPAFVRMMRAGCQVRGVLCDEGQWFDLGDRRGFLEAHRRVAADGAFPRYGRTDGCDGEWRRAVHPEAHVAPDAVVEDGSVVGRGARIESGARLAASIVFPGGRIGVGAVLRECIVGEGREVPAGAVLEGCDI